VAVVYAGAFVQCLAQVAFAASATVFKERLGFSDAQYGAIFLPQIALAAAGAVAGGALARALGLRALFVLGTLGFVLSQAALGASVLVPRAAAHPVVMVATALMGLGAGVTAAPMNAYPQLLFPGRRDAALVALHTLNGAGLTAAPLLAAALLARGAWILLPVLIGAANLLLVLATWGASLPEDVAASADRPAQAGPARSPVFWAFVAMAFFYALAEATFANWAVIFLREEKGAAAGAAALGLAFFWAALTLGRLLVAALVVRVRPEPLWVSLPAAMLVTLLLLPRAPSPGAAFLLYAAAGLACSGFFPLTLGIAGRHFPGRVAWASAMVYAALASGVGAGSFVAGVLRQRFTLAQIYEGAALYPLVCILLAGYVLRRGSKPSGI
jgi:fucose permease